MSKVSISSAEWLDLTVHRPVGCVGYGQCERGEHRFSGFKTVLDSRSLLTWVYDINSFEFGHCSIIIVFRRVWFGGNDFRAASWQTLVNGDSFRVFSGAVFDDVSISVQSVQMAAAECVFSAGSMCDALRSSYTNAIMRVLYCCDLQHESLGENPLLHVVNRVLVHDEE